MEEEKNLLKTRDEFNKALREAGEKLVVVDFYAVWCAPCQKMGPRLKEIEEKFPEVNFYKVNVDENCETTEYYGVTAMPTFILFRNGAKIERLKGADSEGLEALVEKHSRS